MSKEQKRKKVSWREVKSRERGSEEVIFNDLTSVSRESFQKAQQLIPGGVNSPVRAFTAVANDPLFIDKGEGSYIYDLDGNKYLDYACSWGPLILDYNHPAVVEELEKQL